MITNFLNYLSKTLEKCTMGPLEGKDHNIKTTVGNILFLNANMTACPDAKVPENYTC